MSDIRFEGWLHRSGTGGVYQDSAGNVGIASTQPQTRLDIGNGGFQVGPTGIATVTTVNTTNLVNATQLSHRNIIINGAMEVAQRGTSSTSSGYQTVDRFRHSGTGWDAALTQAQGSVSSGTTPYTEGFRKTFKLTNGNQSSGAGAGDQLSMSYIIEDQDLATSGWNYLSETSYVTLSFWFKSSVNQTFYVVLESKDGTSRQYSFAITPTGADTWTKVTHTIKGNSGLQFSNDNGEGIEIYFLLFYGTNQTTSGHTLNTWKTTSASDQAPDMTSTWFTTNSATFELTGMQLEVGSEVTPFEHRQFGDEMARCKRYYNKVFDAEGQSGEKPASLAVYETNSALTTIFNFPKMRVVPSLDITNGTNKFMVRSNSVSDHFDTMSLRYGTTQTAEIVASSGVSGTAGYGGYLRSADTDVYIAFSAEL